MTIEGCQRFTLGKTRRIAHCCHPVKGFASGLAATLDRLPSVCKKAVKEGQINLPSRANFHLSSEVHLMLFHRSEYTKIPLEPFGVVVLNEVFNHSDQTGSISEALPVIPFTLQNSPESFHGPVVNAVGYTGHALCHSLFFQFVVEIPVRILEASIAVEQRMRIWIAFYRLIKGLEY